MGEQNAVCEVFISLEKTSHHTDNLYGKSNMCCVIEFGTFAVFLSSYPRELSTEE